MSPEIEKIKKTSEDKILALLVRKERAEKQAKALEQKINALKSELGPQEKKERINKLMKIGVMIVGENWKMVHDKLKNNKEKADEIKKAIVKILAK